MAQENGIYVARPNTYSDVVLKNVLSLSTKVKLSDGQSFVLGEPLYSADGKEFVSAKYDVFSSSKSYTQNQKVVKDGFIYKAKSAVSAGTFNASNWDKEGDYIVNGIYAGEGLSASGAELTKVAHVIVAGAFSKKISGLNDEMMKSMFKNKLLIRE